MTISIDIYWLVGLVSVMLAYKPLLSGLIGAVKTAVKAYRFAQTYLELPTMVGENTPRIVGLEDGLHDVELRVDDLEQAVFPGP